MIKNVIDQETLKTQLNVDCDKNGAFQASSSLFSIEYFLCNF